MAPSLKKWVVLASGRGSNFLAFANALESNFIPNTKILELICNKPAAPAIEIAKSRNIPVWTPTSTGEEYHSELLKHVLNLKPDFILLAGYMRILKPEFVQAFRNRIVNIHPSLLPLYKGLHAQKQALDARDQETGCTLHFVTEELDAGPIIAQSRIAILKDDTEETLSARLLPIEHKTLVEGIKRITTEKFEFSSNKIIWK